MFVLLFLELNLRKRSLILSLLLSNMCVQFLKIIHFHIGLELILKK